MRHTHPGPSPLAGLARHRRRPRPRPRLRRGGPRRRRPGGRSGPGRLAARRLAVHSQLINCTASEVALMIEGAMRRGHHDERGSRLHGLARPAGNRVRHHAAAELRPAAQDQADQQGQALPAGGRRAGRYPQLTPVLTWLIRRELSTRQYNQTIKYATVIRPRTASTKAILSRFTRNASHPATRPCWRSAAPRKPTS
ncbi:hypothetical protein D0C37_02795 [Streptomyces koyangensis]|uniref:Tn3 transposase DDE domain-containing protein n=1 Tax=Streptomyces koyangensis TaxID=188770 RepID=A0A385D6D6_9ACTN|nr:hypothetical protein D0C37_02795 [Streptomyces koyangensis]